MKYFIFFCSTHQALQEFEELIKSEALVSIETTLPFWPRLYTKLSLDIEKKVCLIQEQSAKFMLNKVSKLKLNCKAKHSLRSYLFVEFPHAFSLISNRALLLKSIIQYFFVLGTSYCMKILHRQLCPTSHNLRTNLKCCKDAVL